MDSDQQTTPDAAAMGSVASLREVWQAHEADAVPVLRAKAPRDAGRFRRRAGWTGLGVIVVFLAGALTWLLLFPKPGMIAGTVRDLEGRPIAGATITLELSTRTVTSDAAGHFELADVPPGKWWVVIELPDTSGVAVPLRVRPNCLHILGGVSIFAP